VGRKAANRTDLTALSAPVRLWWRRKGAQIGDCMKNLTFHFQWLAAGALACVISFPAADAQEQATQPVVTTNVQVTAPPKLPYGVDDVLKLSQAKISDEVIINYIHNSGTVYNLQPKDIVYLRNQGVSDQVLTTMVNQRTQVAMAAQAEAAQNAAAAAQNQAQPAPAPAYTPAPGYDQYAVSEAPAAPAPSTVYVIPNSAGYNGYAPYYGYSYPYYYGGYYGPVVSYVYGYCGPTYYHGGYHGYYHGYGGWHGGYHGGGYHGSTWHGGGGIHVASTGFHGGGGVHVASGGSHGAAHR
jgi:hypothetical protein